MNGIVKSPVLFHRPPLLAVVSALTAHSPFRRVSQIGVSQSDETL